MADKIFPILCVWHLSIRMILKVNIMIAKKSLPPSSIQPAYKKEVFESPSISPPCYCRLFKYSHHILIVHLSCFSNDTHNSSLLQSAFYIHLSMAGKRDGGEYYTRFAIKGNKNEMKKTIF